MSFFIKNISYITHYLVKDENNIFSCESFPHLTKLCIAHKCNYAMYLRISANSISLTRFIKSPITVAM